MSIRLRTEKGPFGLVREAVDLWPRRAPGLPPGQRRLPRAPRFSATPLVGPPEVDDDHRLRIGRRDGEGVELSLAELQAMPGVVERTHDLHCVTTWSATGLTWTGVPLAQVWAERVVPTLGATASDPYVVAVGGDRYRAVLRREDLLHAEVLLAWQLDGAPIDARHGGPLRLVSPPQYGYKSVKHLVALQPCPERPPSRLGPKEHLRARVAEEERHSRWPGRIVRLPFRLTVAPIALVAERSLRRSVPPSGRDVRPEPR